MERKNILILYYSILFIIFFINLLLNIIFLHGTHILVFLSFSCITALYTYYYGISRINMLFPVTCGILITVSHLFSGADIIHKLQEYDLKPTFANYLFAVFTYGKENFSFYKLLVKPGILFWVGVNFIIVYFVNSINKSRTFLENKLRNSMSGLKEAQKYKNDIERYEKTISDLQGKIVELSSRTLVLKDFASQIGSSFEPKEIFNSIIEATVKLIDSQETMILVFDRNRKLKVSAGHNIDMDSFKDKTIDPDKGVIGMIIKNNSIITSDDIKKNFQLSELNKQDTLEIELAAPIMGEDDKVYAILVINKMRNEIQKEHVRMFSILLNISTLSLENSKLFKKVEFMANVDGLTKLYTHRYFQEFLSEELSRATRYNRPLAIIMSDIDHFKVFNDNYGHQIGDMVLEQTAKIFKASVRNKVDLVARYGGEEFIAVLPETDVKAAFVVAERLRKNIEAASYKGEHGETLKVTASLGIAAFPVSSTERLDLIKKADTALYYAKESGRNQVQIFDAVKMKIVEK
jgi:diguanylate cyclase (GGDEF)-like protein